jgi:signal transduction histidine kinase
MKRSIKKRYHLLITILFVVILLESLLLLVSLNRLNGFGAQVSDLQSIVIIFFFVLFVLLIIVYNYVPFRLRKAFLDINALIEEISHGSYTIDIDSSIYDQDTEIQELIIAIQKMLTILLRFDKVKADKIFEHHQRLLQLINLLPQCIIIASLNGDIVYCNDSLRRKYPSITEMMNLNELIFKNDFDNRVFSNLSEAMRYGNNLYKHQVPDEVTGVSAIIDGSIIRNRKGQSTGAVFVMQFSDVPK